MTANATIFSPDLIPQAPDDPHYGLRATYKSDPFDRKVDLIIGVYRDNEGRPWTLPVVKKVRYFFILSPTGTFPFSSMLMRPTR